MKGMVDLRLCNLNLIILKHWFFETQTPSQPVSQPEWKTGRNLAPFSAVQRRSEAVREAVRAPQAELRCPKHTMDG